MSRARILLIEDDQWLAQSYEAVLRDTYVVVIAANPQQAINHLDDEPFDLLIADVLLEGGMVIDVLHELQTYPDTMDVPVILCSSLASDLSAEELAAYGVVRILDKTTVTPSEIRIASQQALARRGD